VQYETEEQQVEALKAWWAENGRAVMVGIAIGVLLVVAWLWWKGHQEKKAVAASDTFSQSLEALQSGDHAKVAELAEVKKDQTGSLYSAYTGLTAARSAVEQGDLDAAATQLQWVVDNAKLDDVAIIARVRLARVKAAQGDAAAGLKILPKNYPEVYTHLIEEARGDLHVNAGDNSAAKTAYQAAIDTGRASDRDALQMKFNELATVGGKS